MDEVESELIFSFIIADATAFKKCIDVFKKLLEPIPFRITKNGIKISQVIGTQLYNESIYNRQNLLKFYFDEEHASDPNYVIDNGKTEISHIFSLDLRSIKAIITSITKKDHIRMSQKIGEKDININIHRDGYPERHSTQLKPLETEHKSYQTDIFKRKLDDPSCVVTASSLSDYLKKISKNQIKTCPMNCYSEGFILNGSSDARHVKADFKHGNTDGKPLFVRELPERVIHALKEMCSITPAGLIKIYIEPGEQKIVRIAANITYIGNIILYILPSEDENEKFTTYKTSSTSREYHEYSGDDDEDSEYSEDDE